MPFTTLARRLRSNFPTVPLARRALLFAVIHGALLFALTALILRYQATLGDYEKPLARASTLINRDQATNSYRRSFNVLALLLQTGTVIGAVDATIHCNPLHAILLILMHFYNMIHALSEFALWKFMINTYPTEKNYNSPQWAESFVIILALLGMIGWSWFAARLTQLWGWKRGIGKYGGQEGMGKMLLVHYVYWTLLRFSPLVLLGYINRQLIEIPASHGSTGTAVDLVKLLIAFLAISAAILLPAHVGLQQESKGLSVFALGNMVVFLIVSVIYYVVGLKRELQPKPINPWADPMLHAVTILFFPMGILTLVAMMVGSLLTMRDYGKGVRELRTSQILLGDESDHADNSPVQLEGIVQGNEASRPSRTTYPPSKFGNASCPQALEEGKRCSSADADVLRVGKSAPFPSSPEPSVTTGLDYENRDPEGPWGMSQNARNGKY